MKRLFNSSIGSSVVLLCSWLLMLVLPHFQLTKNIYFLTLDIMLSFIAFHAILFLYESTYLHRASIIFIGLLATSLVLILQLLTLFGITKPYLLYSRFGSYSMFHGSKLAIFGDLSHLTSAVNCSRPVIVGENLCDLWERPFNQNPDAVSIFRWFKFSNIHTVGIISTLIFSSIFFYYSYKIRFSSLLTILCFVCPVTVLAIDRGNETITMAFILTALILYAINNKISRLGDLFLFVAGIFKIWPFALLVLLHFFRKSRKDAYSLFIYICVLFYSIFRLKDFLIIRQFTQQGDLNGNSFGLSLYDIRDPYDVCLLILGFSLSVFLVRSLELSDVKKLVMPALSSPVTALFCVYCIIWLSGAHFAYRLLIIFPVIANLSRYSQANRLTTFLVISLLTVRMQSSPLLTSSVCFMFIYLLLPDTFLGKLFACFERYVVRNYRFLAKKIL